MISRACSFHLRQQLLPTATGAPCSSFLPIAPQQSAFASALRPETEHRDGKPKPPHSVTPAGGSGEVPTDKRKHALFRLKRGHPELPQQFQWGLICPERQATIGRRSPTMVKRGRSGPDQRCPETEYCHFCIIESITSLSSSRCLCSTLIGGSYQNGSVHSNRFLRLPRRTASRPLAPQLASLFQMRDRTPVPANGLSPERSTIRKPKSFAIIQMHTETKTGYTRYLFFVSKVR